MEIVPAITEGAIRQAARQTQCLTSCEQLSCEIDLVGGQTKVQLPREREAIEFPGTYYFCFPTISNLLPATAEMLNGQFAASHTRLNGEGPTASLISRR